MFNATDDDDLFVPAASSNLAALFGTTVVQDSNVNLMYTAPKQPRNEQTDTQKPKIQSSVILAKVVQLYKFTENKFTFQGKYGFALIGNDSLKAFEIIAYKDKQNILAKAKVSSAFSAIIEKNFVHFDDDSGLKWCVNFESAADLNEFVEAAKLRDINIINAKPDESKPDVREKPNLLKTVKPNEDVQSDTSDSKAKASILSRMAKMGQAILPTNVSTTSDLSDSETDDQKSKKPPRKPKHCHKTAKAEDKLPKQVDAISIEMPQLATPNVNQHYSLINGQLVVPNNSFIDPNRLQMFPNQPMIYDPFNIFVAENRIQNAEVRMNLSQLSAKLENVMGQISKSSGNSDSFKQSAEINELRERNSDLTKSLGENLKTIEELTEKNNKLQQLLNVDNEKDVKIKEQSERIDRLEDVIKNLECELKNDRFKELETLENKNVDLKATIDELTKSNDILKLKLGDFAGYFNVCEEFKKKNQAQVQQFSEKLKQIMNSTFQDIFQHFADDDSTYNSQDIKTVVGKNIKATTLRIIDDFKIDFKLNEIDQPADSLPLVPHFDESI